MKSLFNKKFLSIVFSLAILTFTCGFADEGCDGPPVSDTTQQHQQEQMSVQSNAQVGMPGINRFTEKRIMKRLYEMRDQNLVTYTYVTDMNGRLFHLCDSIGFGLPYGTQFSNPEKHIYDSQYNAYNLPQAEPNGLFMPPTAEGTWVICAAEDKKEFTPVYVEPRVIVSPFKLRSVGEYAAQ